MESTLSTLVVHFFPMLFRRPAPGGGGNVAERHQQQREKFFQLGLFLCLLVRTNLHVNPLPSEDDCYQRDYLRPPASQMVLLDAKTKRPLVSSSSEEPLMSKKSYQQLKSAIAGQEGDGYSYPMNLTGRYQGNWTRGSYTTPKHVAARHVLR